MSDSQSRSQVMAPVTVDAVVIVMVVFDRTNPAAATAVPDATTGAGSAPPRVGGISITLPTAVALYGAAGAAASAALMPVTPRVGLTLTACRIVLTTPIRPWTTIEPVTVKRLPVVDAGRVLPKLTLYREISALPCWLRSRN